MEHVVGSSSGDRGGCQASNVMGACSHVSRPTAVRSPNWSNPGSRWSRFNLLNPLVNIRLLLHKNIQIEMLLVPAILGHKKPKKTRNNFSPRRNDEEVSRTTHLCLNLAISLFIGCHINMKLTREGHSECWVYVNTAHPVHNLNSDWLRAQWGDIMIITNIAIIVNADIVIIIWFTFYARYRYCGFWFNSEYCPFFHFPPFVRPSVTGVTSQLFLIIWWFRPQKPYISWICISPGLMILTTLTTWTSWTT